MEQTKNELQLVSNMIMCGDHPSITKTELNAKDTKHKDEEKEKEERDKDVHKFISYGRISPTSSSHARVTGDKALGRSRTLSEHAVRAMEARRRARSMDLVDRADVDVQGNRALVQAAIGSFRWPPYLLCVWVLVLVLTHALHCLVGVLERALPTLRKLCQYFRAWTETSWRGGEGGAGGAGGAGGRGEAGRRLCPLALAAVTGALYSLHAALFALHAAAVWAVEPLCCEPAADADLAKVTDYDQYTASKLNLAEKQ